MSSIFTQIIEGKIPCHKIYEDDHTIAFLDIHPVQPGHVLVVPKKEVEFIWDLDSETYQQLMATVKKVGLRMREVMEAPYVGQQVVGTDVPHVHVHLIPFSTTKEFKATPDTSVEPDHAQLAAIAERLTFSV